MTTNTDGAMPELPEPYARHAIWNPNTGCGWDQYHDAGDPMPDKWDDGAPDLVVDLYTADQMREYARAAIEQAAGCEHLRGDVGSRWCALAEKPEYPVTRQDSEGRILEVIAQDTQSGSSDHSVPCAGGGVTQPLTEAPRWQFGTWTLTAPDGRTWQADSPLKACSAEQRDRIQPEVALKRIFDALDKGE